MLGRGKRDEATVGRAQLGGGERLARHGVGGEWGWGGLGRR
jgi:hypothetical protein